MPSLKIGLGLHSDMQPQFAIIRSMVPLLNKLEGDTIPYRVLVKCTIYLQYLLTK